MFCLHTARFKTATKLFAIVQVKTRENLPLLNAKHGNYRFVVIARFCCHVISYFDVFAPLRFISATHSTTDCIQVHLLICLCLRIFSSSLSYVLNSMPSHAIPADCYGVLKIEFLFISHKLSEWIFSPLNFGNADEAVKGSGGFAYNVNLLVEHSNFSIENSRERYND